MKKLMLVLMTVVLTFFTFFSVYSGGEEKWQPRNEGLKILIHCLGIDPIDPQILYAGTDGKGVFKTTNRGESWTKVTDGWIFSLGIDPKNSQIIYVAVYNKGVAKSIDGGRNWKILTKGLTDLRIMALVIDPTNTQILYVGTWKEGVFKTIDGGENWAVINKGLTSFWVHSLAIDPKNPETIYVATIGVEGAPGGVYKSTDGGKNWVRLPGIPFPSSIIFSLIIDPTNTRILYAGSPGGIYKTTDGGENWSVENRGLVDFYAVRSLTIDYTNTQILYAATEKAGVFKSIDAAGNWELMNTGLTSLDVRVLTIDPTGPKIIYAGTKDGVFKWGLNAPPRFLNLPRTEKVVTGKFFSFQVQAIDPDGDILTYSLRDAPAGITITTAGLVSWSSPVVGNYSITVEVRDVVNPAVTSTLSLKVITTLLFSIGKAEYLVDGEKRIMDTVPIILENRTLLPIRFVAEPLGASVFWDGVTKKVTIILGTITIELWIGNPIAKVNKRDTPIDPANPKVVPIIKDARTLLPLRFISETLGAEVVWDEVLRTVAINYPK